MRTVRLADGVEVPALGQGTWRMGERAAARSAEIAALCRGLDLGLRVIDTAEMYADGGAEELVGAALKDRRNEVFLVSKAYPQNAGRDRLPRACEASLRRLRTDRLDLYLLHWRGSVPLAETVEAMHRLVEAGKILRWGVSNLDLEDMEELFAAGGSGCATDQILYNLQRRGPEIALLPWLDEKRIPIMAYSPVEQGALTAHPRLAALARARGVSAAQLALAFVLNRPGVLAIPKAGTVAHVEENAEAAGITLGPEDLDALEALFPLPRRRPALEML